MNSGNPAFIWTDAHGKGRNRYALFRRTFDLIELPTEVCTLHLFADTRYRLMINGITLGHGPARFWVNSPEFDSYDLTPHLRVGKNVITLIVNSYDVITFHSDRSTGGLCAWTDGDINLRTDDGRWKAIESPGHNPDTHYLSFALNPAECLDARAMPAHWESPGFEDSSWPLAVQRAGGKWGELRPRSIPMLDESIVRATRQLGAWIASPIPGEKQYSLFVITPGGKSLHTNARVAVLTYLHSPRDQAITLGAWWGKYWLNGIELKGKARSDLGMRQDLFCQLHQGWNTLLVYEKLQYDYFDFTLGIPEFSGVTLSATREVSSPATFLVGGPWEDDPATLADAITWPAEQLPAALGDWKPWPREKRSPFPMKQRGWRTFQRLPEWPIQRPLMGAVPARSTMLPIGVEHTPSPSTVGEGGGEGDSGRQAAFGIRNPPHPNPLPKYRERRPEVTDAANVKYENPDQCQALSLLFEFPGEVIGRPLLDITASPGTIVDLFYTERLKPDGTADVHRDPWGIHLADRYITTADRQQIHTFHPRGFKYLEVLITGDLSAFTLHDLSVTRANYPVEFAGEFECSDEMLGKIWAMGRDTQHAAMEDAYVDCFRERGLYAGDMLVQFLVARASFGEDGRLLRRCIELFLLSQDDDANGLIAGGAFGLPAGRHPDYSAIVLIALHEYWIYTGNVAEISPLMPRAKRLAAALANLKSKEPVLLDGSDLSPYIDNCHMDRSGINCALNCFYQRAFHCMTELLKLTGDGELTTHYSKLATDLAAAIRDRFWDDSRGVFTDRSKTDNPDTNPSVPANALPLLWDIATGSQANRVLPWLLHAMANNHRVPSPVKYEDLNVNAYFSFYALGALYKFGKVTEAESFIRKEWGRMIKAGAWTCWEYFIDSHSRCHAWAAAPTHYLSTQVLGITIPEPGNINRIKLEPHPGTLQWARGVYPHPRGPIQISWTIEGGRLRVEHHAPPGIIVEMNEALR